MALNPQPYLSDSTDEFLVDALPAIAAGLYPEEIVDMAVRGSSPTQGDNMERVLGFLQIWIASPGLITGYLVPMLQGILADTDGMEVDEVEAVRDQLAGALMLASMESMPFESTVGVQLTRAALDAMQDPDFVSEYGTWFVDQRTEALNALMEAFRGSAVPETLTM